MLLLPTVFGAFVWDDHQLIVLNPAVTGLDVGHLLTHHFWDAPHSTFAASNYYRPVVTLAHAFTWAAGGGDALPFHALSLVLHALCSVLTFVWLTRRIEGADTPSGRAAIALATVVFALHPARVQSVAWASASTDLWATLFVLVGLNLLTLRRGWAGAAFAGLAMSLALFSKESAIVAPALVIADRFLGVAQGPSGRETAAMLTPVGLALIIRSSIVGLSTGGDVGGLDDAAGRGTFTLGSYLLEVALPVSPEVQTNTPWAELWALEPGVLWTLILGVLALAGALALMISARKRPAHRPWLADVAWLLVPLVPVSNVLPLGEGVTFASRLLYLPLLGATALAARALVSVFLSRSRTIALALCGLVLVAFAVLSSAEIGHWRDDVTLTRHWREQRPNDVVVADSFVRVLAREGQLEEAYIVMSERLDADPTSRGGPFARATWAMLRLQLTSDVDQAQLVALRRFFDAIGAADVSRQSLELPERAFAVRLSRAEATELMNNPAYGNFHDAWGWSHARTLDIEGALRIFVDAPETAMGSALGHDRRARALGWNEDWDGALATLEEARRRFPAEPWDALGQALARGRRLASTPPPDPIELTTEKSRVMSDLGLPVLGRALLAPIDGLRDVRIVDAHVQAHVSDQRLDLALAELEQRAADLPEHAAALEAARVELEELARRVPSPRDPPIWTRPGPVSW